jgi:4,5-dihydroxyphthalate decarboxylase
LSNKVKLTLAIAEFPHTSAIRNGSIPIEGVDAEIITVEPQIGAFRRMVRNVEFDVCELAPTTYIIARAYPVFWSAPMPASRCRRISKAKRSACAHTR